MILTTYDITDWSIPVYTGTLSEIPERVIYVEQ